MTWVGWHWQKLKAWCPGPGGGVTRLSIWKWYQVGFFSPLFCRDLYFCQLLCAMTGSYCSAAAPLRPQRKPLTHQHQKARSWVPACDVYSSKLADADVTSLAHWMAVFIRDSPLHKAHQWNQLLPTAAGLKALSGGGHGSSLVGNHRESFLLPRNVTAFLGDCSV